MKLSEMKEILARWDIQLTKSLGQNFLHDGNQLRRIVEAAALSKSDKVLEIGPGLGPLTELLVEAAGEVLAIETDVRLVEVLQERLKPWLSGDRPGLRLVHADALDYLRRGPHDWGTWKLVANLPFSVASPLLVEMTRGGQRLHRIVVTLQLEVSKRLMAGAGDPDYGVLTLLVQLDYEPDEWFRIPASCFFPEPEVDSACVTLVRREQPLLPAEQRENFVRIVKRSFSQRRKMMLKLLTEDWPAQKLQQAFKTLELSPAVRAETVSLEHFVRLTQNLS